MPRHEAHPTRLGTGLRISRRIEEEGNGHPRNDRASCRSTADSTRPPSWTDEPKNGPVYEAATHEQLMQPGEYLAVFRFERTLSSTVQSPSDLGGEQKYMPLTVWVFRPLCD